MSIDFDIRRLESKASLNKEVDAEWCLNLMKRALRRQRREILRFYSPKRRTPETVDFSRARRHFK